MKLHAALRHAGVLPKKPEKPMVTSGIRIGSPATTTRGFGVAEFKTVGALMLQVLDSLASGGPDGDGQMEKQVRDRVLELCARFPIYGEEL